MNISQGERLVRVEEQVNELREKVDRMDTKLDQLLALRYKGMGAFWLATTLVGAGIIGLLSKVFHFVGLR